MEDKNNTYIDIEYLRGFSFKSLNRYNLKFFNGLDYDEPEEYARYFAAKMVVILEKMHNANVIHLDLNPSNIILSKDNVYLIDFSFARTISSVVQNNTLAGATYYRSPEMYDNNKTVGKFSDYWSLGVVLYSFYRAKNYNMFNEAIFLSNITKKYGIQRNKIIDKIYENKNRGLGFDLTTETINYNLNTFIGKNYDEPESFENTIEALNNDTKTVNDEDYKELFQKNITIEYNNLIKSFINDISKKLNNSIFSPQCASFILGLLHPIKEQRISFNGPNALKSHEWFSTEYVHRGRVYPKINFTALDQMKVPWSKL